MLNGHHIQKHLFLRLCLVRVQLSTSGCFINVYVPPASTGTGSPFMQKAVVVFCNPCCSREPGSIFFSSGGKICWQHHSVCWIITSSYLSSNPKYLLGKMRQTDIVFQLLWGKTFPPEKNNTRKKKVSSYFERNYHYYFWISCKLYLCLLIFNY